jgi:hypothetical protein
MADTPSPASSHTRSVVNDGPISSSLHAVVRSLSNRTCCSHACVGDASTVVMGDASTTSHTSCPRRGVVVCDVVCDDVTVDVCEVVCEVVTVVVGEVISHAENTPCWN